MLAYMCRHCGQFTICGIRNEFNEHFCTKKCYIDYCDKFHYAVHLDRLENDEIISDE